MRRKAHVPVQQHLVLSHVTVHVVVYRAGSRTKPTKHLFAAPLMQDGKRQKRRVGNERQSKHIVTHTQLVM